MYDEALGGGKCILQGESLSAGLSAEGQQVWSTSNRDIKESLMGCTIYGRSWEEGCICGVDKVLIMTLSTLWLVITLVGSRQEWVESSGETVEVYMCTHTFATT